MLEGQNTLDFDAPAPARHEPVSCEGTLHEDREETGLPIASSRIHAIVAERNAAISAQREAHACTQSAEVAIALAGQAFENAGAGKHGRFNSYAMSYRGNGKLMHAEAIDTERFEVEMRRSVDGAVWGRIMEETRLKRLMDSTAKERLRIQLEDDPPQVSVENVHATIAGLVADAEMIFRRGMATCFSNLDRRFRTHDGFKVGRKIILDAMFTEYGSWNHYGKQKNTLLDVERTLRTLDGHGVTSDGPGIIDAIETEIRSWGMSCRTATIEDDYIKVRTYGNGNCHVWFKRDDLIEKVNKLLAEYYGEVLGDASAGRTEQARTSRAGPSRAMAKGHGFYPTPQEVAHRVISEAQLRRSDPPLRVLEPSAGSGALAQAAVDAGCSVECIEIQPKLAEELRGAGPYARVMEKDFLTHAPGEGRSYDRIVMNPPFDGGLDIAHVEHALRFLGPGGRLVAVMSAGTEFRETRQAKRFRETMKEYNARWIDLPQGAFESVGTKVNTIMIVLSENRSRPPGW